MSKTILIKLYAIIVCVANNISLGVSLPQNRYIKTIELEPICTDNETGRKLLIGESLNRSNNCTRIQCIGDEYIWQYECNVPNLNGDCEPIDGSNPHGLYPECCSRFLCIKKLSGGSYVEKTVYDQYGSLIKKAITQIIHIASFERRNSTRLANDVVL